MPDIMARSEIVLFLIGAGVILAACGGGGTGVLAGPCPSKTPATAEIEGDLTTDELVDLVAEAMTCPGHVIHLQSAVDHQAGDYGLIMEMNIWLDIENNVGRTEWVVRAASEEALRAAEEAGLEEDAETRNTVIIRVDARYEINEYIGYPNEDNQDPVRRSEPPGCHGPGLEALASLILCAGPDEDYETTIEQDVTYGGQAAIALLTTGESSFDGGTSQVTSWLYFDTETLLPLGIVIESKGIVGGVTYDMIGTYEFEFLPLDSLATDFFDPASIGFVEKVSQVS